ncbi:MAG: DUF4342 domain-containing protein [Herpetosiphonaceae bacterium]|nr:DUF4342 domain-containing protein [Herpetosiphonaceae bacterium]
MTQASGPSGNTGPSILEEITVAGGELVERVRALLKEGNIRRLIIQQNGHTLLNIPLEWGILGTLIAPELIVIAGIGAVLTECTIQIVRTDPPVPQHQPQIIEVERVDAVDKTHALPHSIRIEHEDSANEQASAKL